MVDTEEALNLALPHRRERLEQTFTRLRRRNREVRTTDRQIQHVRLRQQELHLVARQ